MELKAVMRIAMDAGEILLSNGAETYRVEESIIKICNGFGYSCDAFVFPTGIFLTVRSPDDESESSVRRVKTRTLNLSKIDRINTFSRNMVTNPSSFEEATKELEGIRTSDYYPAWIRLLCSAVVAFAYAFLFGGNLNDGIVCLVIGAVVFLLNSQMVKSAYLPFLTFFIVGFACGFLSLLSQLVITDTHVYIIIIASVILYLPGVSLTNGVRDLLAGDLVSGLTRLGEAVLVVLAIGMGAGLAISISPTIRASAH
ncbi:MAG: threonine/serine exporter family protein [Clostridiaceae bacterium]|jgi:uncharacterized membrane protein YjjP (DUF1212 family)|nr:threonine/serine exporter family protein [Clostridiaceae bacterium]